MLDTAGDLGGALNAILIEDGHNPLAPETIRPHISKGGMALVELGYGYTKETAEAQLLWNRLILHYSQNISVHTRYFEGINAVIGSIEASGRIWGVVTNKPSKLTDELAEQIGLSDRTDCIVSGDTLSEKKPSPAPLLHACRLLGVQTDRTIYIGDHPRDIEAGLNAGMLTLVSAYGYIGKDEDPKTWGAHGIVHQPEQIHEWLK